MKRGQNGGGGEGDERILENHATLLQLLDNLLDQVQDKYMKWYAVLRCKKL